MHGGLIDIAEWLGYEVVGHEESYIVRRRMADGKWEQRTQYATAAEVHLYDTIRALVMSPGMPDYVGMIVVARAFGMDTSEGVSVRQLLDVIVETLETSRKRLEAYEKAEGLVNELREALLLAESQNRALNAALVTNSRVGPKGGDRGELARQVKLGAKRMIQNGHPIGSDQGNGIMDMADLTLRLLGEEVPCVDEWLEMTQ